MVEQAFAQQAPDPQTLGNPETAPFWQASAEGRLLIKHCQACNTHHWYPRAHCPHCGANKTEWVEASGNGTIYTFTVLPRAGNAVPAYVTLDEGVTMFTNIVETPPEEVAIGNRVSLRFRKELDGVSVPVFAVSQSA